MFDDLWSIDGDGIGLWRWEIFGINLVLFCFVFFFFFCVDAIGANNGVEPLDDRDKKW
jgi:hypothetical protein